VEQSFSIFHNFVSHAVILNGVCLNCSNVAWGCWRDSENENGGTKMVKTSNFLTGLLAVAVVGEVAGLILASKPGGETSGLVSGPAGLELEGDTT